MEDIVKLLEAKVNERVQEQIAQFAHNIATKYHLGINEVLRCAPDVVAGGAAAPSRPDGTVRCRGICGKGKNRRQCTRNVKAPDFYCRHHLYQGEEEAKSRPSTINHGHTHPASILYQEGCPKCTQVRRQKSEVSSVIDLGLLCK